jgi:Putative helicase
LFYQNKRAHSKVIARSKLMPVLKAEVLLSDTKRKDNIEQIQNHLGFDPLQFQQLITPLLDEVALNYQLFPSSQHRFYALPGGLLDFAIYRAQAAIYIFRQSVLAPDTKDLSDAQALWAYVLFTAALLRGSGGICTHYQIECFNVQGHSTGFWKPLWERLLERTPYYLIDMHPQQEEDLSDFLTLYLAKAWMPNGGFQWIDAHPEMFLIWLKLLKEEKEALGILEAILERAEAVAWQLLVKDAIANFSFEIPEERTRHSAFSQPSSSLPPIEILGLKFLLWLKENLVRGQIIFNQHHLRLTEQGLIIEKEAFKWFVQQNSQFKNWRLVQQALTSLNLHDKDFSQKDAVLLTKWGLFLPKEMIIKQSHVRNHLKIESLALNYSNNAKLLAQGKSMDLDFQNKRLNAKGQFEVIIQELQAGFKNV